MLSALWSFEVDGTAPAALLKDKALLRKTVVCGLSPAVVRAAIEEHCKDQPLILDLATAQGTSLRHPTTSVGDMLLFNWLPVFSERAHALLVDEGCRSDEFVDCRFRMLDDARFKIHIPLRAFEVLDFARSRALYEVPLNPPIPFRLVVAHLLESNLQLPPCFRVPAPGHPQVLCELFAQDGLRTAWSASGFRGATFRRLADDER